MVLFEAERDGTVNRRPLHWRELVVAAIESLASGVIGDVEGPIVQILRGKVGSEVGAVTPDRAVVHEAVFQEHLLPARDVGVGEQDGPGGVDDLRWYWGRILVCFDG